MQFLVPLAGFDDKDFGIITSPKHGIALGVRSGLRWGADLGCITGPDFVKRFDPDKSMAWLERMLPYRETCLFIAAPDHVGDAAKTYQEFFKWRFDGWPVAYIAQDGQENIPYPPLDMWQALFVGGSTEWKLSDHAKACIFYARNRDMHIHIGRVNSWKRYKHFRELKGSERFTCDGTKTRYEKDKALADWKRYMVTPI